MKKFNFALAAAVAALAVFPMASQAADATGDATATIVAPLAIANAGDLNYGTIAPSASAGAVTMTVGGSRTGDANVELLSTDTGGAATFNVTGEGTSAFSTTVDATVSLTDQSGNGGAAMSSTLVDNAPSSLTSGAATINVGGVLTVGANQTASSYAGTFNVTVAYN